MVKLNISCYIWSSLNLVVWIMVKRLMHSLLPEFESFSSRLLWVPPSVWNGGSALMSWWFLKLQSLCILAMHLKSQRGLFQKWSFFPVLMWNGPSLQIDCHGKFLLFLCYSLTHHKNPREIFPYGAPLLFTGILGNMTPPPPPPWKIQSLLWGWYGYFLEPHNRAL